MIPKSIIITNSYGDFEFGSNTYRRELALRAESAKILEGVKEPSEMLMTQTYLYAWYKSHVIKCPESFSEETVEWGEFETAIVDLYKEVSERWSTFRSGTTSNDKN